MKRTKVRTSKREAKKNRAASTKPKDTKYARKVRGIFPHKSPFAPGNYLHGVENVRHLNMGAEYWDAKPIYRMAPAPANEETTVVRGYAA